MILEGRTQSWAGVERCNGMRGQLHNFDEISGEAFAWLGRTMVVTVAAAVEPELRSYVQWAEQLPKVYAPAK